MDTAPPITPPAKQPLPPVVKRLGFVSFFTDAATEMLYPLLPIFITGVLGAPAAVLGLIEGGADAVSQILRLVSGRLTDHYGRHRLWVRVGYTMSAAAKPLLAGAFVWPVVLVLRLTDRIGKAVRGTPRDSLLANSVGPEDRGRAFGLHRSMDSAGAVVGPLIGAGLLAWWGSDHIRWVFVAAAVPAFLAVWFLRKLPLTEAEEKPTGKIKLELHSGLYKWFIVAGIFGLVNSSDAFLLLRAADLGMSAFQVTVAYTLFNIVDTALSVPFGKAADRFGRKRVYTLGLLMFSAVYAGFAAATSPGAVWPLFAAYGVYKAIFEGVGRAVATDLAPPKSRGSILGLTQAITGTGMLVAGITAGVLYDQVSHAAPFVLGAVGAFTAAVAMIVLRPSAPTQPQLS